MKWGNLPIAFQNWTYLLSFLTFYCMLVLVGIVMVMRRLYLPSIYSEFQQATEFLYNNRTSNLTSAICTRLDGFENNIKMPSYLIAIAVGDLEYRSLGRRVGVITEPS